MFCYNCGKEIMDIAKFCPFCGSKQMELEANNKTSITDEEKIQNDQSIAHSGQKPSSAGVVRTNVSKLRKQEACRKSVHRMP